MRRFLIVVILLVGLVPGVTAQQDVKTLTIEEYTLVAAAEDSPTHFEFRDWVTEEMLAPRQEWREPDLAIRIEATNAILEPSKYRLVPQEGEQGQTTYMLTYGDDTVLVPDITRVWPVAVSDSGQNFALLLDTISTPTLIVTPETIGQLGMEFIYIAPVFVGEDLYSVEADWEANTFTVSRNGESIYIVTPDHPTVAPPIQTLGSWDGHWVLETEGQLLIDGASLNDQLGYDEIFGWQLIAGQPFYFFVSDGQVGMSYAGEALPYTYTGVAHSLCCEASMFNISGNGSMLWFFAERDSTWFYVEVGLYE